jgi:hypothetical protein
MKARQSRLPAAEIVGLLREQGIPIRSSTLKHYLGGKRASREALCRATGP